MPIDAVIRRIDMIIDSDDTRGRCRSKLTLDVVVKNDMIGLNLSEHLRAQRPKRIHVAGPIDWDKGFIYTCSFT